MSDLPKRSLAVILSLGSLGLLWPPLLTARTLNWYFIPSTRSGTLASHLFPMTSTAFCHLELEMEFREFSMLCHKKILQHIGHTHTHSKHNFIYVSSLLTIFWDFEGPTLELYQERCKMINSAHCCEVLSDELKAVI